MDEVDGAIGGGTFNDKERGVAQIVEYLKKAINFSNAKKQTKNKGKGKSKGEEEDDDLDLDKDDKEKEEGTDEVEGEE